MKNSFVILLISLLLSGCSLMSPLQSHPNSTYMLNTLPAHIPHKNPRPITMLVLQPDTRPIYNTTQMAYSVKPYQVAFYGRNQWAETPSQMLLPLIVQSLQNTHYFHAVVTPPYAGRYSYVLTTQILQLQQNFLRCVPSVDMIVRVQLTGAISNQVVATKLFKVSVPIRCKTPYGGVIAANQATAIILAKIVNFSLTYAN